MIYKLDLWLLVEKGWWLEMHEIYTENDVIMWLHVFQ